MLKMTPAPSSKRTSKREPPERKSPKSMNGIAAAGSGLASTGCDLPEPFKLNRQRRNTFALSPSRRQNSGTDTPLLTCLENSSRQAAALRLTRFTCPIVRPAR
jgi:hypothetical protein